MRLGGGSCETPLDVLVEFLEVAIHRILHARGLYPEAIFERRRKYDSAVFMSRHPDLNLYIRQVLDGVRGMLVEGSISQLMVCFNGPQGEALDAFVFEVSDGPRLLHEMGEGGWDARPVFRTMLERIAISEQAAKLPPLSEDATFTILLFTKPPLCLQTHASSSLAPEAWADAVNSGQWVPARPDAFPNGARPQGLRLVPLAAANANDPAVQFSMSIRCSG